MRDPEEGVSASGAIVTGARRDRVPSHFEPVLAAASDLTEAGDERVAVYLYGSVATGQARVPTSDVDLLTIDLDPDIAQAVGQELTDRFRGVCRAVEIAAGRASDYRGDIDAAYDRRSVRPAHRGRPGTRVSAGSSYRRPTARSIGANASS